MITYLLAQYNRYDYNDDNYSSNTNRSCYYNNYIILRVAFTILDLIYFCISILVLVAIACRGLITATLAIIICIFYLPNSCISKCNINNVFKRL